MSAEYGVNIDYTSLGRIHFKIELMADSHEQALKSAQDVLNIQKKWFKKHKQETLDEHKRYKTLLRHGPDYDAIQQQQQQKEKQQIEVNGCTDATQFLEKTMTAYKAKAQADSKGVF
jgi:hypothetical protein